MCIYLKGLGEDRKGGGGGGGGRRVKILRWGQLTFRSQPACHEIFWSPLFSSSPGMPMTGVAAVIFLSVIILAMNELYQTWGETPLKILEKIGPYSYPKLSYRFV